MNAITIAVEADYKLRMHYDDKAADIVEATQHLDILFFVIYFIEFGLKLFVYQVGLKIVGLIFSRSKFGHPPPIPVIVVQQIENKGFNLNFGRNFIHRQAKSFFTGKVFYCFSNKGN